jgi:hypothetical protein
MPIDIKHALSGKYATTWRKAIRYELASLHIKGTFRMENLPLIRNAIGNKWVFKVKANRMVQSTGSMHDWLLKVSVIERESTTRRRSL